MPIASTQLAVVGKVFDFHLLRIKSFAVAKEDASCMLWIVTYLVKIM